MKLIYSYSTNMRNYKNNEWIMQLYRASIIRSKFLGYSIKLYGCKFAYDKLYDIVDEYIDITDREFILTDDLKIFIHSNEDLECITIDGDVILESKLKLPSECDVIYERTISVKSKSERVFEKYLNTFKPYDVESHVKYFNYDTPYICSTGILKFNNQFIKDTFLSAYYQFRDYFITNIKSQNQLYNNDNDLSVIICEYMLSCILMKTSHIGKACNQLNNYTHYISLTKFSETAVKHVDSILNPTTKML